MPSLWQRAQRVRKGVTASEVVYEEVHEIGIKSVLDKIGDDAPAFLQIEDVRPVDHGQGKTKTHSTRTPERHSSVTRATRPYTNALKTSPQAFIG